MISMLIQVLKIRSFLVQKWTILQLYYLRFGFEMVNCAEGAGTNKTRKSKCYENRKQQQSS
jgi:hypothetical protein